MAQVAAVVVAAGQGVRAGGDLPKQFKRIGGETLLRRSLLSFLGAPDVNFVQPVIRPEDADRVRADTAGLNAERPSPLRRATGRQRLRDPRQVAPQREAEEQHQPGRERVEVRVALRGQLRRGVRPVREAVAGLAYGGSPTGQQEQPSRPKRSARDPRDQRLRSTGSPERNRFSASSVRSSSAISTRSSAVCA